MRCTKKICEIKKGPNSLGPFFIDYVVTYFVVGADALNFAKSCSILVIVLIN
jgi:hypothetical protein